MFPKVLQKSVKLDVNPNTAKAFSIVSKSNEIEKDKSITEIEVEIETNWIGWGEKGVGKKVVKKERGKVILKVFSASSYALCENGLSLFVTFSFSSAFGLALCCG